MNIVNRYLFILTTKKILGSLVLVSSLFFLIEFINQSGHIGTKDFTTSTSALFALYKIPEIILKVFHIGALLGVIFTISYLKKDSEIVNLYNGGISRVKFSKLIIFSSFFSFFVLISLSDTLAPYFTERAEIMKSQALGNYSLNEKGDGFWLKRGRDFLYIEENLDGRNFRNVSSFEISETGDSLLSYKKSNEARVKNETVNFLDPIYLKFVTEDNLYNIKSFQNEDFLSKFVLTPEQIEQVGKAPESVSLFNLIKQIKFQVENNNSIDIFLKEILVRLASPLEFLALLLISMSLMLKFSRGSSLSREVFLGFLLGIVSQFLLDFFRVLLGHYSENPLLFSLLPSFLFLFVGILVFSKALKY